MSYFLRKLEWYPKGVVNPVIIEEIVTISTQNDDEPTNDICSISLYNTEKIYDSGVFLPQENDIMVVYDKKVTSASLTAFTDDDIIWTGKYLDRSISQGADSNTITLKIARWSYNVFNQYSKESYYNRGLKTNEVLEASIKTTVENSDGAGGWQLDFSNIASTRNNGTDFPIIKPTMVKKPMWEFVVELGQINNTNAEIELVPIISKPMVFDIKGKYVYWYERPTMPSITLDDESVIFDIKESSHNEEGVTKLILDCGRDFNGNPIHSYLYNEDIDTEVPKETALKKESIAGLNETYDNTVHALRSQFTVSTNSDFIDAVRVLAQSYGKYWFKTFGAARTKISVTLDMKLAIVSDILDLQLNGYEKGRYVIKSVSTTSSNNDRSMTLSLEKEEVN